MRKKGGMGYHIGDLFSLKIGVWLVYILLESED